MTHIGEQQTPEVARTYDLPVIRMEIIPLCLNGNPLGEHLRADVAFWQCGCKHDDTK